MDRNALMGPFQQGYAGNVVERGNIIPAGTYEDGVTRWAWPGIIDAPWEAWKRFARSGGEDVKAGAEVATNALMGGMLSPKPANVLGSGGGNVIRPSSMSGARAAAYRQQQLQEAIRLMRSDPNRFATPEGYAILDDLERAAASYSFGPSVKAPPAEPGSVLPFNRTR